MNRRNAFIYLFLLLFSQPPTVFGELEWKTKDKIMDLVPEQSKATTQFVFKNIGSKAVSILGITSCCNCTFADPDKKVYFPGEVGVITASFAYGDRVGTHEKYLMVHTDDAEEPTIPLTMKAEIPEFLMLTPKQLTWKPNATTPQTVNLKLSSPLPKSEISVRTSSPAFSCKIRQISPQASSIDYELTITPVKGSVLNNSSIYIEAQLGNRTKTTALPMQVSP